MTLQLHGRQFDEINCPSALPAMPVCHKDERGKHARINLLAAGQLKDDSLATNLYGSLTIALMLEIVVKKAHTARGP